MFGSILEEDENKLKELGIYYGRLRTIQLLHKLHFDNKIPSKDFDELVSHHRTCFFESDLGMSNSKLTFGQVEAGLLHFGAKFPPVVMDFMKKYKPKSASPEENDIQNLALLCYHLERLKFLFKLTDQNYDEYRIVISDLLSAIKKCTFKPNFVHLKNFVDELERLKKNKNVNDKMSPSEQEALSSLLDAFSGPFVKWLEPKSAPPEENFVRTLSSLCNHLERLKCLLKFNYQTFDQFLIVIPDLLSAIKECAFKPDFVEKEQFVDELKRLQKNKSNTDKISQGEQGGLFSLLDAFTSQFAEYLKQ